MGTADLSSHESLSPLKPKNSMPENQPSGFIPPHGGYRKLITYQKAEIIYDGTVYFTKRFFQKFDRTIDQMVQAARSGKQNIAEASMASATSKETELKLTNVARASLEELMLDYEDFLRTKKLNHWTKDHRLTVRFRELNKTQIPITKLISRPSKIPTLKYAPTL